MFRSRRSSSSSTGTSSNNKGSNRRVMDEQQCNTKLSSMVIGSVDTLRGYDIDQFIPIEWNSEPPQLLKVHTPRIKDKPSIDEQNALLKSMLRVGVPIALRCSIWLSNIIQSIEPQQSNTYWLQYRTLAKVKSIDTAYDTIVRQVLVGNNTNNNNNTSGSTSTVPQQESETKTIQTTTTTTSPPKTTEIVSMDDNNNNNTSIDTIIKNFSDWDMISTNTYGRKRINDDAVLLMSIDGITANGKNAIQRVLVAIDRIVTTDYAPLIPSIVTILLTVMSESYVFCSIREMLHQSGRWYFPVSQIEHNAWCKAFIDIFKKLHPITAEYLDDRGVFDTGNLDPIFSNFFINLLPIHYIHRIMDLYTLEGSKVLYRFGVSLLVLYKIESSEQLITISNAKEWWSSMKQWTHNSKRFDFDAVVRKAYGAHGRGLRRMMRFPRRRIIQRLIRLEEQYLQYEQENNSDDDDNNDNDTKNNNNNNNSRTYAHPLGLIGPEPSQRGTELEKPVLAQSVIVRTLLAKWLPITLQLNNLHLLYSTNYHGRTLERFYSHVQRSKHTVFICEVLPKQQLQQINNPSSAKTQEESQSTIIGMYASQAWQPSTHVYGDGGVFLFRLQPNPTCWKWHPIRPSRFSSSTRNNLVDHVDLDDDSHTTGSSNRSNNCNNNNNNNQTALLEQFMVGTTQFISMGGNADGSSGLRINEDLTTGESSTATGFDNEPLHGLNNGSVFDIGLVEVYGFVRQIDGKPL